MSHRHRLLLTSAVLLLLPSLALAAPGYLRTPDVHGDQVLFAAEADLWLVPLAGGEARRLTTHDGDERIPRFSPDGKWIAFTADYDGNPEVYVIPARGGEPRRLTLHPASDTAIGWTPDGQVLFRSTRTEPHGRWELFTVPPTGGELTQLPVGWAARLSIEPGTGRYAFVRTTSENRTWKRYRGGTAPDVWVGDPARAAFAQVTDFEGSDDFPMWHGGLVYFLSDQGGTANLWSMKPDGSERKRLTDGGAWDARWPAMGPDGRIVYMLAGDIHLFDPADGSDRALDIDLPSDLVLTRERFPEPSRFMTWADISPDGDRVVYVTRGEVFSVPVEDGPVLPVSATSSARESWAGFSPDGQCMVWVTDEGGEESIVTVDAWGRGDRKVVLPMGERGWHFPPRWSPDGKLIAWSDNSQTLWVAPAAGGAARKVDQGEQAEIRDYSWSRDGRWLAWSKMDRRDFGSVRVWDSRDGSTHRITGQWTSDHGPVWDPQGRYLFFLGERHINPLLGARDFEYVDIEPTLVYAVLLRKDVPDPFAASAGLPPRDGAQGKDKGKGKTKDKKKDKDKDESDTPTAVEIDFDGIGDRIVETPVPAGSYTHLACDGDLLYYLSLPTRGMADEDHWLADLSPGNELRALDLEEGKVKTALAGVLDYELALGGDKLLLLRGKGSLYVVDAAAPVDESGLADQAVSLDGLVLEVDPRQEWRQIFIEGWRHMRDFYWDQPMTGVDWRAERDRYMALLPRLATRDDLRDLMGELIGELATSHTYVWGGDPGVSPANVSIGLLGAELVRTGDAFAVRRVYRGDPADNTDSPLLAPSAGVKEGEYVLAVNHRPFPKNLPYTAALVGLATKPVVLTVSARADGKDARDVVVTPLGSERDLRYHDWVRRNREHVAAATGGRIGYVHVPDMGTGGLIAFDTWFYAQLDKEGLVIDVRWNGGGFVSQLLVERLRRRLTSFDRSRGGAVNTYPYRVLNGPFVVLTNEMAGSDGDIFPATIQAEGLAPVIGKRSWGGVIGIRADKRMVDGGILTQPEYAYWGLGTGSGWTIENHGVDPDIVIDNLPQEVARGVDAQLDRGIEEVLRLRKERPHQPPEFGPAPDKSRGAFKEKEE